MTPQEEWRPIPGFEGRYEVSNAGRVRSLVRRAPHVLKPTDDGAGYRKVSLSVGGGVCRYFRVHALVLLAFVGPRPEGHEVRHLDDNKANNRLDNLVYGTKSENSHDAVRNGGHPMARKTHCKRGHEFTPENTKVRRGGRACRACHKLYRQRAKLRSAA